MEPSKTLMRVLPGAQPSEGGIKSATRHLLLETAMQLIQEGQIPTVPEVARHARVSRATAYRYYPSRSALITAVIDASLGPVRTFASEEPDGCRRVRELFTSTFPRFKEFEPQLRAAVQLSLEQWALERAGQLQEERYRRGHRIAILAHAIEPLRKQLKPKVLDRLHKALSVLYGIEPRVVLKDIWGLPDEEVEAIALWMADAILAAALAEGQRAGAMTAASEGKAMTRSSAKSS